MDNNRYNTDIDFGRECCQEYLSRVAALQEHFSKDSHVPVSNLPTSSSLDTLRKTTTTAMSVWQGRVIVEVKLQ